MSAVVADTQSAIWYLIDKGRLSNAAEAALDGASQAGSPIYVASISLVELVYLVEKNRLPMSAFVKLSLELSTLKPDFEIVPLSFDVAQAVAQIPRDIVPDMPDRIIAATALHLNLPLVTSDHKIQATTAIQTIW